MDLGPYRVEAAIALVHTVADPPDWNRIAELYALLDRIAPSPVVTVHRALAIARSQGPRAGLSLLDPIVESMRLDDYAPFHAVHAELLAEAGDAGAAEAAWHRALAASSSDAQRDAMSERIRAQPSSRRVDGVG